MADLYVSVPQVQVKLEGGTFATLTRGDLVPSNTTEESLANLRELGFVRSDGELTHDELAGRQAPEPPAKKTASK